jgi:hypothetical protein
MFAQLKLYLMIGAAAIFAAVLAIALWYRGEAIHAKANEEKAKAQLEVAVEANEKAMATIDTLKKQSLIDGRLAADLAAKNRELEDGIAKKDQELEELAEKDQSVRDFLNTPVPNALRGMYHH